MRKIQLLSDERPSGLLHHVLGHLAGGDATAGHPQRAGVISVDQAGKRLLIPAANGGEQLGFVLNGRAGRELDGSEARRLVAAPQPSGLAAWPPTPTAWAMSV
jgi:hypothetical protein